MALAQTTVTDGFTSMEGGMDAGRATNLLPRNKVAFSMNVTMRGGFPNNRPGWNNIPLSFPDEETQTAYLSGVFQGSEKYIPDDGDPFWFVSVSGHIYRLLPGGNTCTVEDLTPNGDPNVSFLPTVWMCQADSFMVIQDGLDAPFVYDGNILRRSTCNQPDPANPHGWQPWLLTANKEVPTGTAMAYGYGRLFLVRNKNVEAGDILDAAISNSAILFTEVLEFQDSFAVPITSGDIKAIIFGANIDTSIGQGPLQLHTSSGQVITLNVTVDRATWTTTSIQDIGLMGGAATGQNAAVNVNNDTWFRSHDGLRSFVVARRQFSGWGNTPQSLEIDSVLNYNTPSLLQYASGVWFDNRLLMTVSPQLSNGNRYFQGLAVLDFNLLGGLNRYMGTAYSSDAFAAYDGFWSGLNICQISKAFFGAQERCFIFSWDAEIGNQLWELSTDAPFDNGQCPVLSWLETGSYNFNNPTILKKLSGGDLWIDQLIGDVDFNISWSPDQYPFWIPWQEFHESSGTLCPATEPGINPLFVCTTPENSPPQYRSRLRLQQPEIPADGPETIYPLDRGYDFRMRVQWNGRVRLKGLRVFGLNQEDETTGCRP